MISRNDSTSSDLEGEVSLSEVPCLDKDDEPITDENGSVVYANQILNSVSPVAGNRQDAMTLVGRMAGDEYRLAKLSEAMSADHSF